MPERPVWVLGGGGVAGIAWEVGILAGLADEGATIAPDSVVIGTSAGSLVGALIASGMPLPELYDRQLVPAPYERAKALGFAELAALTSAQAFATTAEQAARRIGARALVAQTGDTGQIRANIEARLPSHEWGELDLRIVAVDAASGAYRVFTRADGVSLVDVVEASCAVPLISPVVRIEGRQFMDGGMRSTLNLDLAPGSGPVIALAPSTASIGSWGRIPAQRASLGADRPVLVLAHDGASRAAQGRKLMDPSVVPAVLTAGRAQGRREAAGVVATLVARA